MKGRRVQSLKHCGIIDAERSWPSFRFNGIVDIEKEYEYQCAGLKGQLSTFRLQNTARGANACGQEDCASASKRSR